MNFFAWPLHNCNLMGNISLFSHNLSVPTNRSTELTFFAFMVVQSNATRTATIENEHSIFMAGILVTSLESLPLILFFHSISAIQQSWYCLMFFLFTEVALGQGCTQTDACSASNAECSGTTCQCKTTHYQSTANVCTSSKTFYLSSLYTTYTTILMPV